MASYQILEPKEEEELFKTRLLNVEEKPFKRLTKRLATLNHLLVAAGDPQEPTPPPEGLELVDDNNDNNDNNNEDAAAVGPRRQLVAGLAQVREDATLDFAAFDASVARLQFLYAANERERARYAADRGTILATCQAVRANMTDLRAQLEQARTRLAQRKVFDDLADRITTSKTLRPRPDQQAAIRKLEEECRELQRETAAYAATWRERKEQFARIVDESMRLRRLIRDEKEEVERREGMDDEEAAGGGGGGTATGGAGGGGGSTHRPRRQVVVVVAGGLWAMRAARALRSQAFRHRAGAAKVAATVAKHPIPEAISTETAGGSASRAGSRGPSSRVASRAGSQAASREPTPNLAAPSTTATAGDDVDMAEASDVAGGPAETPLTAASAIGTPLIVASGASTPAGGGGEQMDTT
ncbi:Tho complex subunit 7/Mft1p [Niveomyces insectorum RCEF 264]|uniref:Tho complex subunit 7/Mft1p n=1 Tax=Niveomyces insectorum RCEF 264 TaxID=1081102 RepID=A0A167TVH8_9HYPO|nr:Tho complex subunit 7/Mft1p [Niveomyces insectorum RCEF 264]